MAPKLDVYRSLQIEIFFGIIELGADMELQQTKLDVWVDAWIDAWIGV